MKILVIFTGGTIGSAVSEGWISPQAYRPQLLLKLYSEMYGSDVQFTAVTLFSILSENISAENISSIICCVTENINSGYDGIIITHGTDTLMYTAAAIGYAVAESLPVVLVSSNYELLDERANGVSNFAAAVDLIRSGKKGVFVTYKNSDRITYCHTATRLLRHNEADDSVYSLDKPYGSIIQGKFTKNSEYAEGAVGTAVGRYTLTESSGVLNILCHPGDNYAYSLDNIKAVLLQPYHSGTLNTENPDFISFCESAAEKNIPVFLVNSPKGKGYASNRMLDGLKIIRLPLCAAIPIYMKLWLAVSLNKDLEQFIQTPIYGEFI